MSGRWGGALAAGIVLLAAAVAPAQPVTVSCPALLGAYDAARFAVHTRTTAFQPAGLVSSLTTIRLHWTGTSEPGIVVLVQTGEQFPISTCFYAFLSHPTAGTWYVRGQIGQEAFDETLVFARRDPGAGDLSALLDGTAQLTVELPSPVLLGVYAMLDDPTGTLTACELLLDGTVATEPSTWSQVKRIFR